MTPGQAIEKLDEMQRQIIHGKRIFGDIADMLRIAERAMNSIRDFPCAHKPNGVGGKCGACEALKQWDALSSNDHSSAAIADRNGRAFGGIGLAAR